jgi:ABC-type sugar transport system substrate-binding protein
VRPCDDVAENAKKEALGLLGAWPDLKAIVGFCSPAVPGAAEALKQVQDEVRLGRCHIVTRGNLDSFN